MILADTSVWIDHLRTGDEVLAPLLDSDHPLQPKEDPSVITRMVAGSGHLGITLLIIEEMDAPDNRPTEQVR